MIESRYTPMGALPSWLSKIVGTIVRGTQVTVPTPAGNVVFDLSDPKAVATAKSILSGARVSTTVGNKPQTPLEQASAAVESVPGGWLTLAGAALALVFLMRRRG